MSYTLAENIDRCGGPREGRSHNYGIDLLRIWMCFEVVLNHFWSGTFSDFAVVGWLEKVLYCYRDVAVPAFIFLSFFLCAPSMERGRLSTGWLRVRMSRLLVPVVFWGVVLFVIIDAVCYIFGGHLQLTFIDLILQLLFGHVYNTPMWYMSVLIAQTLTVAVINCCVARRYLIGVYAVLTVSALAFCLTGLNEACFGEWPSWVRYTVGRYFETLPFVGVANVMYYAGYCGWYRAEHQAGHQAGNRMPLGRGRVYLSVLLLGVCVLLTCLTCLTSLTSLTGLTGLTNFLCGLHLSDGFGYSTLFVYLVTVPCVLLFVVLPISGRAECSLLQRVERHLGRYTAGIYFVHMYVGERCNDVMRHLGMAENTIWGCVVIFLVSYVVCLLVSALPVKWAKKAVT